MMDKDKLVLDLEGGNEELAEHFSRKEVGETCKITIDGKLAMEATIDEIDPGKMVVLSLVQVEAPATPAPKKAKPPVEPVDSVMSEVEDEPGESLMAKV